MNRNPGGSFQTCPFYSAALFLCLASSCVYFLSSKVPSFSHESRTKVYIPGADNTSIYIFLVTVNPTNLSRVTEGYQYWGRDFAQYYPKSLIRVGTPLDLPTEHDNQFIAMWNNSISPIQNLLLVFIQGLHDFYYSTDMDWIVRTTEDCLVDIRRLPKYIKELEKTYNPKTDNVLKGHLIRSPVIVKGNNYAYIHGGSGWIMSRAAAKHFIENEQVYLDSFFSGYTKGDDVITFDMMNTMHLPPIQVQSYEFLGFPFTNKSINMIMKNDYSKVQPCLNQPDSLLPDVPFKNVIFWHSGRADTLSIVDGFRILSNLPDQLSVEFEKSEGNLCLSEGSERRRKLLQ